MRHISDLKNLPKTTTSSHPTVFISSAKAVESFPDPTSLSWRSLRMVLFLLMWRRRSNTKTDRPAKRTASNPPTTPAAIKEKPDVLKDRRKQIYTGETEKKFRENEKEWYREVKPKWAYSWVWRILLHLLTFYLGNLQDQDQCTWKTEQC